MVKESEFGALRMYARSCFFAAGSLLHPQHSGIHRTALGPFFLAYCGHIPFQSLFSHIGHAYPNYSKFLIGLFPADTPFFRQAPSPAFTPHCLSHAPRKYLHRSKYSHILTSDRCPCRWIPHHPRAASFCPWPIRICGHYRPS